MVYISNVHPKPPPTEDGFGRDWHPDDMRKHDLTGVPVQVSHEDDEDIVVGSVVKSWVGPESNNWFVAYKLSPEYENDDRIKALIDSKFANGVSLGTRGHLTDDQRFVKTGVDHVALVARPMREGARTLALVSSLDQVTQLADMDDTTRSALTELFTTPAMSTADNMSAAPERQTENAAKLEAELSADTQNLNEIAAATTQQPAPVKGPSADLDAVLGSVPQSLAASQVDPSATMNQFAALLKANTEAVQAANARAAALEKRLQEAEAAKATQPTPMDEGSDSDDAESDDEVDDIGHVDPHTIAALDMLDDDDHVVARRRKPASKKRRAARKKTNARQALIMAKIRKAVALDSGAKNSDIEKVFENPIGHALLQRFISHKDKATSKMARQIAQHASVMSKNSELTRQLEHAATTRDLTQRMDVIEKYQAEQRTTLNKIADAVVKRAPVSAPAADTVTPPVKTQSAVPAAAEPAAMTGSELFARFRSSTTAMGSYE